MHVRDARAGFLQQEHGFRPRTKTSRFKACHVQWLEHKDCFFSSWKKRYKLSFYHMFQNPNISIKFPSSILKITVPADKTNTTWRSQYSVKNTIHIKICTRIHFLYSHVQSSDHCQRTPCHCELTQEKIAHLPNYIRCPRETQWTKSEIEALTSHQQSQLNTVFPKQRHLPDAILEELECAWRNVSPVHCIYLWRLEYRHWRGQGLLHSPDCKGAHIYQWPVVAINCPCFRSLEPVPELVQWSWLSIISTIDWIMQLHFC